MQLLLRKQETIWEGREGVLEWRDSTCKHTQAASPETAEAKCTPQTNHPAQEILYFLNQ